jgi:predicted dehydrogenase/threonine dehydrogenase-like Zn-dependent dehydrogenase
MVVDFAEKNLLEKARSRPDLVRQVMDKAQREGIVPTIESVKNRLDQPMALGYSSAGLVVEVGSEAGAFQIGDRVACAGGGYASHAEHVYIPRNLAVKMPDSVSYEAASFATIGAIALQGIRQGDIQLGHNVAVIGLGLLGQLTVQMLKAAGCRVFGVDLNAQRVSLAQSLGADLSVTNDSARADGETFTNGRGFDAVLITADTKSNDPIALAGDLARDRAVVVAVGAVGLEIPRKVFYEKEIDVRLSRSYGPGRYDAEYEEKGHDYPYGYVRWTEQRNIEAFLNLIAAGSVNVQPLISHRYAIDDAATAYDVITGKTQEPFLGVVLQYDIERDLPRTVPLAQHPERATNARDTGIRVGVLGAGNFVNATLLPAMKDIPGLDLVGIVSGAGMTARSTGDKFGFQYCASADTQLLDDASINWVVIATRHDLHARQAIEAMSRGKNVFVEKPLALNQPQLVEVAKSQRDSGRSLMVGFNRRFAPMVQEMKAFLAGHHRPLVATYRINAGAIPRDHWTQDPEIGGGRIIGEACHFIDLLAYLTGSSIQRVQAIAVETDQGLVDDEVVITMTFADGSIGTVIYTAGGDKSYSKERIEIFGDGRVAMLEDFRHLTMVRDGKKQQKSERIRPARGHRHEWLSLVQTVTDGSEMPIPFNDIVDTHLAAFAAIESLRTQGSVDVASATFWEEVATT